MLVHYLVVFAVVMLSRQAYESMALASQAEVDMEQALPPQNSDNSTDAKARREILTCIWPNGTTCCKRKQCTLKYTPVDVLVLRHALSPVSGRPRGSVDRRQFLSNRYKSGDHLLQLKRGTGVFMCDTPYTLGLPQFATLAMVLPMKPVQPIQIGVCQAFFIWAFHVSKSQMKGIGDRVGKRKHSRIRDCGKAWTITEWLSNIAKLYQAQPDSGLVLLPFANRRSVFNLFIIDEENAFNNRREGGEQDAKAAMVVSPSYFMTIWRYVYIV